MALGPRSLGTVLALFALPFSASASLGGDAASVHADQRQMNATLRMNTMASYTQFEMQTLSGTLVHEYVSPASLVFAVVWNGPALPDLRQLLGSFLAQYVQEANAESVGTGPRVVEQPGLVVYAEWAYARISRQGVGSGPDTERGQS
jgi:uncharacterized protein DUF2844